MIQLEKMKITVRYLKKKQNIYKNNNNNIMNN